MSPRDQSRSNPLPRPSPPGISPGGLLASVISRAVCWHHNASISFTNILQHFFAGWTLGAEQPLTSVGTTASAAVLLQNAGGWVGVAVRMAGGSKQIFPVSARLAFVVVGDVVMLYRV